MGEENEEKKFQTTQPTRAVAVTLVWQTAIQIVSTTLAPRNEGPIYRCFGKAGYADPLDGWYCSS